MIYPISLGFQGHHPLEYLLDPRSGKYHEYEDPVANSAPGQFLFIG